MRKIAAALLFVVAAPAQAAPYFMNGPYLVESMREYDKAAAGTHPENWEMVYEFREYVAGVYDSYSSLGLVCTPPDMSRAQIGAVVSGHLKNVPDQWHRPAVRLVSEALLKVFPCQKKGGKQ